MATEDNVEVAGWDSISAAFTELYGPGEPAGHWGTVMPWSLGGPDPLHGVSAYASTTGRPHWHYVSLGLTELFEKESEDPDVSGFGFELCFRLARGAETEPPLWPVSLLQNLAKYVFKSGNVLSAGHHMNANGPICLESDTKLRALAFTDDPALSSRKSPNGTYDFVHVVGVTLDELDAIQLWNTQSLLALAQKHGADLVSDLSRDSYLADAAFAEQVRAQSRLEGSSCGSLYNPRFGFEKSLARKPQLSLGAKEVPLFAQLLPARLLHDRALLLIGRENRVRFQLATERKLHVDDETLVAELTREDVASVAATLAPRAGKYEAAGIAWLVEKSVVKNDAGEVIEEIG